MAADPWTLREAITDAQVGACWPVIRQLRPHLTPEAFLPRVRRQQTAGYRLVTACREAVPDAPVAGVAGFRVGDNLAWGRFLYVDDLVTDEASRGSGAGVALIAWLVAEARHLGCEQLHLDSGVQRFAAHRFYLSRGMDITSHHFAMRL